MGQRLIALDQLLNTMYNGGYADETFSARCHRMALKGEPKWINRKNFIDCWAMWLFKQPNHCEEAYHSEMNRKQLPPIYSVKEH